jgi:hypothetical protein
MEKQELYNALKNIYKEIYPLTNIRQVMVSKDFKESNKKNS